jgi:hypothetical protein
MAMSSVSVVLNSLLLKYFNPKKVNVISLFAPVIMTMVFLVFFRNFAQLGKSQSFIPTQIQTNPTFQTELAQYLTTSQNKL